MRQTRWNRALSGRRLFMNKMAELRPNITPVIARLPGMRDVLQTRRMACAIIANALVCHQRIAGPGMVF